MSLTNSGEFKYIRIKLGWLRSNISINWGSALYLIKSNAAFLIIAGLLNSFSADEQAYVQEFDAFFKDVFKAGASEIEVLDEIYSQQMSSGAYDEWYSFKNRFSNAMNEAAWFVVEKSKNPEAVKKAVKWSESSLRIEKNNPYYLDTLAQLYYKNGEKQKAIATQEQALKFSETMDEQTIAELKQVLQKMKIGTY